jgi:hypothetical protein
MPKESKELLKIPPVGSPVYIEWEDSCGCGGRWQVLELDEKPERVFIHSLGWITAKNEKNLRFHPNVTDRGDREFHGNGDMTIPVSALRKIKSLNVWSFS